MRNTQQTPAQPSLRPGVYTPLPTFFHEDEEINLDQYRKHLLHVVSRGAVPVCAGSLGEAVHLSRAERLTLISCTRQTLDEHGYHAVPIVAGVGASSTRETVQLAQDAASAGASVGMVISPAYYAATLQQDSRQIERYYIEICQLSPIPLLLYNFPANSAGQDLTSSSIRTIIDQSPNLCGVKLTCDGRVKKLVDISCLVKSRLVDDFLILDGVMHDLLVWKDLGGHGTVSGISNIAPSATVRLWELCSTTPRSAEETWELQDILSTLSRVDAVLMPLGVRGLKNALGHLHGFSVAPRRPLLPLEDIQARIVAELMDEIIVLEKKYCLTVV